LRHVFNAWLFWLTPDLVPLPLKSHSGTIYAIFAVLCALFTAHILPLGGHCFSSGLNVSGGLRVFEIDMLLTIA
jgi:hypothetical protein